MNRTHQTGNISPNPVSDPRVYLAIERTFLAWIRTGLALMGFGFVVARFGMFLREIAAIGGTTPAPSGASTTFGAGLVLLGVVVTVLAIIRYRHQLDEVSRGSDLRRPSKLAITLGAVLAAIGLIVSVYLLAGF